MRNAVTQFALTGLAAVLLVGAVAYLQISRVGRDQAIDDAKQVAGLIGRGIVAPELPADPVDHPGRTRARLDRILAGVIREPLVRVKLWSEDGTIVYSDQNRLIGTAYQLGEEELATLRSGGVEAELSDLSKPENRFERDQGELLEVYFPIVGPDGDRLLFESYARYESVISSGRDIRLAIVPALLGALALLAIVQVPLAARMARRIRDDYDRREALLRRAVEASDRERRRIAADLHDGVVQRMAGATYSLDALAASGGTESTAAAEALRKAAAITRQCIRELRTTLIEIYPPSLERAGGLAGAIRDLLARLETEGLNTALEIDPPEPELGQSVQQLVYRVVQEALRNVERHAHADRAEVRIEVGEGTVRIEVSDDGIGLDPEARDPEREQRGHLGLALIRDLVADAGGSVEIEGRPGAGTTVTAELPS